MNSLRLYLSTLSHLKPRQFYHLAKQRLLPGTPVRLANAGDFRLRAGTALGVTLAPVHRDDGDDEFSFLNVSRSFSDGPIDWVCADMPKLWRYNLHYFDYLHDTGRPKEVLAEIVSDWIDRNPIGAEDAWEPYTISLRIVNWIKWFLREHVNPIPPREWVESLYLQAVWLEKNIEYHLLANHYLKNAKALFFAGAYFSGADAERWLRKGLEILREEASEQVLPDGGHFERSPMYHCLVLEDYLDVLNLALTTPGLVDTDSIEILNRRTALALDFLNDIVSPSGQIPLFNDSAFGIAPAPKDLFKYAHNVIGYERADPGTDLKAITRPDTGLYVIRDNNNMLIIDCGQIGPDYQPGHAHCDTLSYELYLDGRPVVVDAGVYDYENSEERKYSRSTRAHNTIAVDGQEQSEIWGVFRVAGRARPTKAVLEQLDGNRAVFKGAHDGYKRLKQPVTHQRTVTYERATGWSIADELIGEGVHKIESFIHFSPDLKLGGISEGRLSVVDGSTGQGVAEVLLSQELGIEVIQGKHFPEFGICEVNQVVRLYGEVVLPFHTEYRIRAVGSDARLSA